jgi:hypothetical protein
MAAFDNLVNALAVLRDQQAAMRKSHEIPFPAGTAIATAESLMYSRARNVERISVIDDVMTKALRLQREGKIGAVDVAKLEAVAMPLRAALS